MMERNEGDQLWWVFTWVITGLWCLFMCTGCWYKRPPPKFVATSDNLTIIDLSGEAVDARETAEFVRVFIEEWERHQFSSADAILRSLDYAPIVAYFPPADVLACAHTIEDTKYGTCIGMSQEHHTAIFVARPAYEAIGCGALAHELAHVMLSRFMENTDGKHNKFPQVWKFGGMLDQVKIKLGCEIEPLNLRVWK